MYNLKTVSDKTDLSIVTLRRYIKSGKLAAKKTSKGYEVSQQALDELLGDARNPEDIVQEALEENTHFAWFFQRSQLLSRAARLMKEADNKKSEDIQHLAFIFGFSLDTFSQGKKSIGNRFRPRMSGTTKDGKPFHSPDPNDIDEEVVATAKKYHKTTANPITRAVLADLVFEYSTSKDRHDYGLKTIRDCLKASSAFVELPKRELHALRFMLRALELSLAFNDIALRKKVIQATFDLAKQQTEKNNPRISLELTESLLNNAEVTDEMESKLRRVIDLSVEHYIKVAKNEHLARSFMELYQLLPKVKSSQIESKKVTKMIVGSYLREAESKDESGGLVMAHFLGEALKAGEGVLSEKEVKALRKRIQDFNIQGETEMKEFKFEVTFTNADVEKLVSGILADTIDLSLIRISAHPALVPKYKDAKELTEELARDFPMQNMFTQSIYQDGRKIHESEGTMGVAADDIMRQLQPSIDHNGIQMGFLFDELVNRGLDASKMAAFLSDRDLYTTPIMPAVAETLELFFEKKYYSFVTVASPLLEKIIRDINTKLGFTTLTTTSAGLQRLSYIKELLGNLGEFLGEDRKYYFDMILHDKRGLALRDNASHGLNKYGSQNRSQAMLLLHCMLILALYQYTKKEEANEDGAADEQVTDKTNDKEA